MHDVLQLFGIAANWILASVAMERFRVLILPNDSVLENGEGLHILVFYGHFIQEHSIMLTWANTRLHPCLMTIIPFTFFTII